MSSTIDIGPELLPAPKPGFYPRVEASIYHAWDAASKSRLTVMEGKSPAHLKEVIDHGQVKRDCFRLGDAEHAIILQPERFAAEYITTTNCMANLRNGGGACKNGGKYRIGGEWFCGQHCRADDADDLAGTAIVTPYEMRMLEGMRKSIAAHPLARELLMSEGYTEASYVWKDPDTGEMMKCRTDRCVMFQGKRVIPDVKTTVDASPAGFPRQAAKYHYDIQAAIYTDGVSFTTGEVCTDFYLVAVENKAPYAVCVYHVPPHVIQIGRTKYQKLLKQYAECRASGIWPAYPTEMQELDLPAWADTESVELTFDDETVSL